MTFFLSTMRVIANNASEYRKEKSKLLKSGYRMTRDYNTASHFNKAGAEVVLIKEFAKEVTANGRT